MTKPRDKPTVKIDNDYFLIIERDGRFDCEYYARRDCLEPASSSSYSTVTALCDYLRDNVIGRDYSVRGPFSSISDLYLITRALDSNYCFPRISHCPDLGQRRPNIGRYDVDD